MKPETNQNKMPSIASTTELVLNAQHLSYEDAAQVRTLASRVDRSQQDVPGYGVAFYFDSIPSGWAGDTSRIVAYGPDAGLKIWDARRA